MRGRIPLFRLFGIRVLLHWTFALLPAYIAFTGLTDGSSWQQVLMEIGLVLIVFLCVVLHEFGHALTARHYGVGTRDITLLPIGGVASLERMPEEPRQEFWITMAGPLVNLAIAILAFVVLALGGLAWLSFDRISDLRSWTSVITFVLTANLGLFLFNLIPAFPMDGGRILRSLLGLWLSREQATRIATIVGRVLAAGFVIYGLYSSAPFLAMVGVFIYMAAGAEARQVEQRSKLLALTARSLMRTGPIMLDAAVRVQEAWNAMTMADQRAILVTHQGLLRGVVLRGTLQHALNSGEQDQGIGAWVSPIATVTAETSLLEVQRRFRSMPEDALLVMEGSTALGLIFRQDLAGIPSGPGASTPPASSGSAA